MQRTRTLDIFVSALVVLLIGITFAPAIARLQRSPAEARCQSNLHQWAGAMALYLADNQGFYPTNKDTAGWLQTVVYLTPGSLPPMPDGKPRGFVKGVNWVEALYPYLWTSAAKTGADWKSFTKCPNARDLSDPPGTADNAKYAAMTYAFNSFLAEQPLGISRTPRVLMMMREMDRRVNSLLRPSYNTTYGQTVVPTNTPRSTFLTTIDTLLSPVGGAGQPNRHGTGSYILFADGHTKWFSTDYYPKGNSSGALQAADSWDATDACWYNYNSTTTVVPEGIRKTIAITP